MAEELDLSTLDSRPPWHVVKWLKRLAIGIFAFSVFMIVFGLIAGYLYMQIPGDGETEIEAFYNAASSLLEDAGYYGLVYGFYALILWLASQGVDRIDQLVWLKADETDRRYIYNQRTKKKKS
ncbi:MAG: hypothetical protein ABJN69_17540 [Hellea sp.]